MTQQPLLAEQTLTPCRKGMPALTPAELNVVLHDLPAWQVVQHNDENQLQCVYTFPNFAAALAFTNAVGALAEAADHHPALTLEWGKVTARWWTHVIHGLHRNDCIMAARTDACYQQLTGASA
jgi:4a-hydroxytetrahydrobiopterin dehydratase